MQYSALLLLIVVGGTNALDLGVNPVTRVVQLLEGLSKKLTVEAKAEQDLFDTYGCWAKTIIDTKTATNAAAEDRIASLEAYIADIEAGNIEFTTERIDLEKQIAALEAEIAEAKDLREKEHEDFLAAKDEMEKAIAALEEAVEVLGEVNKGNLLSLKFDIRRVLQVGSNILSKSDLTFMEHLLDGDVPNPDWKKLNRKATFKMEYSPRSKKIHTMLQDMLQTFVDNLAAAEAKEKETQESFDALMESKNAELESAQTALTDASQEGAARGLNKNEAQAEVDDLKAQVEADKGFIADTEKSLEEKTKEFEERKKLRMGEIGAISEAIGILRSDEARDTFNKSYKSQGYLLLQMRHRGAKSKIFQQRALMRKAFAALRKTGEQAHDAQLSVLALKLLTTSNSKEVGDEIKKVIEAIDKMIARLEQDEEDDLKQKEECEKDRMSNTADARSDSLGIDDATEEIARQETKIKEQKEQIKLAEEAIKKMEEELKEAERTREDEKAAFESDKTQDEAAVELITKAMDVLKSFYSENFSILQVAKQPPKVVAGEAPPPPPPTFEGGYGGAKGEANGIQSILGLIKEDIEGDIEKNEQAEKEAVEAYETFKTDTKTAIEDEEKTIADAKSVIADAESEMENQRALKKEKHESLKATLEQVKAAEPGCTFISVNFKIRVTNRQLEMDGLKKAKAILQGGDFSF